MNREDKVTRLPVDGETLWTATVEPSLEGSGALSPNPQFPERLDSIPPSPEIKELLEAFSTPVDLDKLDGTWP